MYFRQFTVLCSCLLLALFPAFSQKFNFENYTVNDGLPNNAVKSIAQDELGFMYFGTNNGLGVYDGSVFSRFVLPGIESAQQFFRLRYLASGKLWINFTGNKQLMWLKKGVLDQPFLPRMADINNFYETPDSSSLICTDGGLFRLKGSKAEPINLAIRDDARLIHLLYPVGPDNMLILRRGYSVALINKHNYHTLDQSVDDISVTAVEQDKNGDVWLATDSHGLLMLDGAQLLAGKIVFKKLPAVLGFLGKEDIFCISKNRDNGNILLGTSHYGIVVYHEQGELQFINRSNGLSSNKVSCMYQDKDKNWWIGTDFGVDKLNNGNFIFYTVNGAPIGSTYRLEKDHAGNTWYFGNEQMYRTHGDTAVSMDYPPGVEKIALGICAVDDGLWVTVPHHVFFIRTTGSKPAVSCVLKTEDSYRRIIRWDTHTMLLGGGKTLAALRNNRIEMLSDKMQNIRALAKDHDGTLWVGTFSDGIYRLKLTPGKSADVVAKHTDGDAKSFTIGEVQRIADTTGTYNRFLCLLCDRHGRMWAGTRFNGIYLYQVDSDQARQIRQFSVRDGLGNNFITSLDQAPSGDVWVGTSTGFDRIVESAGKFQATQISQYSHFNTPVHEIIVNDEFMWAATDVGAVRLRITKDRNYLFPTWFKDLVLPDSIIHLFSNDTTLHFTSSQNTFSISFTAPFYINEQQTRYFYRLMHHKASDWTEIRGNRSINFTSLQSGNYVLELKSIAFNGQPTSITSRLAFVIATPFYRTTWFIGLVALSIALVVYGIYWYRIKELKKLYLVRDNISRNLHDEIGATLSSINIYSDVARQKVDDDHEIRPLLDRIYTGSGQVMENMNDIVWYVNPKNDSWEDIVVRMREFAIPILEARDMDVSFNADERLLAHKLTMQQRQNIYFIFKEAVNNIAKYSKATVVRIELDRNSNLLTLSLQDNGKGFDVGNSRKGNGLVNMHQRAAMIRATLVIDSIPGEGTSVFLRMLVNY